MSKKLMLCLMVVVVTMSSVAMAAHHEGGFEEMAATWEAAYNKGDVAAVAAMYADDGMRMPPDMPMVKGRAAIQEQIQAGLDRGMVQVKIAVSSSGGAPSSPTRMVTE